MTRGVTAAVLTELQASGNEPRYFIEIEFAGGTVNFWTGTGSRSWDSKTWTAAANALVISTLSESATLRATGAEVTLNGITSANLSNALSNARQNKAMTIWIGFLDSSNAVVADPYKVFSGFVDVVQIAENPESAAITVAAESRLITLTRRRTLRYSSESQKQLFSGDKGLDFIAKIQNWNEQWGVATIPPHITNPFVYVEDVNNDTTISGTESGGEAAGDFGGEFGGDTSGLGVTT